jgi:hypothetical protein
VPSVSARPEWSTRWAAVTLGSAVTLAACSQGGEVEEGSLPLGKSDASAATSVSTLTAEQERVASALARYDSTLEAMSGGGPLDVRKIRTVATAPKTEELGNGIRALKAFGQRTVGKAKRRILDISVNGSRATAKEWLHLIESAIVRADAIGACVFDQPGENTAPGTSTRSTSPTASMS